MTFLQKCMMVFGMYYKSDVKDCNVSSTQWEEPSVKRISKRLMLLYNVTVITIMWLNVVRSIVAIVTTPELDADDVPVWVVATCWYFMCAVNMSVMFKSSHPKTGHMCVLCNQWGEMVYTGMDKLAIKCDTTPVKRKLIFVLVVGFTCIIVTTIVIGIIIAFPNLTPNSGLFSHPFILPFSINNGTKVLGIIILIYCNAGWVLPMMYVICFSSVFCHCFQVCNKALENEVKQSASKKAFPPRLCRLRRLHMSICRSVETLDKDVDMLFANWYITNLPTTCFILFHLITRSLDTFLYATLISWLGFSMGSLLCTSGFVAYLNEVAHSPLEHMYDICMVGVTVEQNGQVQLFLSKLTGTTIGFTVLKFLVITKEMLLTICGLYVTYFFVLLSFSM